jgi:phosphonate transport system substrate-binding protein
VAEAVSRRTKVLIEFKADATYEQLGGADVAFACSLAYIVYAEIENHFEPLAAPVLTGSRYGGQPVYYSDVIVHKQSGVRAFTDLRGRSWAYNEVYSQSGYGIARFHLARMGETGRYFGRVVETGRHDRAIRLVADGQVDAAAIDSHVLATYLRLHPELASALRIIDSLGPSPIQPVLVRRDLPAPIKAVLCEAFMQLDGDPTASSVMAAALVERFVPVDDRAYDPVRRMRDVVAAASLCWGPAERDQNLLMA